MPRCTSCAEADPACFSKRMLAGGWARKGAPVRCKACVARGEEAERAAAAAARAESSAVTTQHERCAGCAKQLPAAAFSRSQLLQKGDAKKCRECVSAAAQAPPLASGGLLAEAPPAPRGAPSLAQLPEPRAAVELARLKKLKLSLIHI